MSELSGVEQSEQVVLVYWRPGCGFCHGLLRGLERAGLDFERANIWEDEQAAAFVRGVTGGDETVPTVRIGPVALVNPSDALPAGYEPPVPGAVARFITRLLGG